MRVEWAIDVDGCVSAYKIHDDEGHETFVRRVGECDFSAEDEQTMLRAVNALAGVPHPEHLRGLLEALGEYAAAYEACVDDSRAVMEDAVRLMDADAKTLAAFRAVMGAEGDDDARD